MRTSRKLAHALLALFALVVMSSFALAADPGLIYPPTSEASDQKAGSLLIYTAYTSGPTTGVTQNTRINLTNTSTSSGAAVHLFFVSFGCSIADSFVCLTPTQTVSFVAEDVDPGISGYIVAVATNSDGCPVAFNWLIGDLYIKFTTLHSANLGAIAFAALWGGPGNGGPVRSAFGAPTLPGCDNNSVTARLNFNGVVGAGYNMAPRVLADDYVASASDGNNTKIIIDSLNGNLTTGASGAGTLFGLFYDDSENVVSFSLGIGCQTETTLSDVTPRLTPRFTTFIPAGRSGWFKVYSQTAGNGIVGSAINYNASSGTNASAFSGGHNLHHLTLDSGSGYTIPVFPPNC